MPPRPPGIPRPGAQALSRSAIAPAPPPGRPGDRASSGPLEAREGSEALRALLGDLGARIRSGRGLAREVVGAPDFCPTGIGALDARLGGGFPRGRISEVCGPPSSGRTALATALLAETLAGGTLAAWVDPADAFDPVSTAEALAGRGVGDGGLRRLLWVRARTEGEAIRSCERILATEGFALAILDLAHTVPPPPDRPARPTRPSVRPSGGRPAIREAAWLRLARLAARHRSALVVLSNAPQTGARAELVLELRRHRIRFTAPPRLLDAIETTAVLRRHRTRPGDPEIRLSLDVEPEAEPRPAPEHASASASEPHVEPARR